MLRCLDRRDTLVMKALAISAIVFHNYFHVIHYSVRENEFDFDPNRFWLLSKTMDNPVLAIQAIFSFFGHFGVQVFIFLSAYGLAKSHWDESEHWNQFVWGRVRKLYPLFGVVILPWFLYEAVLNGPVTALTTKGIEILCMAVGISSLLPGYGLPPIGPWWFIPFIVQFYVLWPPMRRFTIRFGQRGILVAAFVSLLIVYFVNPFLVRRSINLLETPVGHLPELCLGIIAARYPTHPRNHLVIAACLIVLLGSLYRAFWPLTFASALVAFVMIYFKIRPVLRRNRVLQWIGRYSVLIFLLNGIVRFGFLPLATSPFLELVFAVISAAASFALAAFIQSFILPSMDRQSLELSART